MNSPATSLTQAVLSGDEKVVSEFLQAGADVNSRNASGQTALIVAIASGQSHLVPFLLKAGAEPLVRDNIGLCAVDWAERKGRPDLKATLLGERGNPQPLTAPQDKSKEELVMTPSPQRARQNVPDSPATADEKARKWISGLRARFEEKAREQKSQPLTLKSEQTEAESPAVTETQVASRSEESIPDEVVVVAPQPQSSNAVETSTGSKQSRKRCPQCNAIYDGELLGYCAHHVVPLVDIDAPVGPPPSSEMTPWLWLVLMVSLSATIVAGYYLIITRSSSVAAVPSVEASSSLQPNTRTAPAIASTDLASKATSLPDAECPPASNGATPSGTVVVKVKIDKTGRVYWTRSSGGDWLLRAAAMEAASKATFSAERLQNNNAEGTLTYVFKP